jgi:hypothetical protein
MSNNPTNIEIRNNTLDEAIKVCSEFAAFTGAGYSDINSPFYDPSRSHDYGRGGEFVKQQLILLLVNLKN